MEFVSGVFCIAAIVFISIAVISAFISISFIYMKSGKEL